MTTRTEASPKWTVPNPHGLDRLPDDACGRCGGLGFVWLSQKYRCPECAGNGKRLMAEAA